MSKEVTIRIQYIATALIGVLLYYICIQIIEGVVIYNTYVNLLFTVIPYSVKCIFMPFAIMSVFRFFVKPIYEGKLFYISAFSCLAYCIVSTVKTGYDNTIFYVIFACAGTALCMMLHELFNAKNDKTYGYKV